MFGVDRQGDQLLRMAQHFVEYSESYTHEEPQQAPYVQQGFCNNLGHQVFPHLDEAEINTEKTLATCIGPGIYDSVYDFRDKYDDLSGGNFESSVRAAFVDILIPPCTLRLGKQQVVWGEADNFRALDVINPLDLTWHWSRESREGIHIPLWIARGIYDIGKIGPIEESFAEVIWIPRDFKPNRVEADPRYPWPLCAGLPKVTNSAPLGVDGDQNQFDTVHQSVVMVGIGPPT